MITSMSKKYISKMHSHMITKPYKYKYKMLIKYDFSTTHNYMKSYQSSEVSIHHGRVRVD